MEDIASWDVTHVTLNHPTFKTAPAHISPPYAPEPRHLTPSWDRRDQRNPSHPRRRNQRIPSHLRRLITTIAPGQANVLALNAIL